MRICLVYDCLFPWTIGGAERYYRNLGERLAAKGHDVTYLTLTQWDAGDPPDIPGIRVVSVGPRMALYHGDRRTIAAPLRFGLGVLLHLIRHARRYDVVQTVSFPFFSLLAIGLIRPIHRPRVVVDWFEVWTKAYWRSYLGRIGGGIGWLVQRLCAKVPQRAYAFSRLHAARLGTLGLNGEIVLLTGAYDGVLDAPVAVPPAAPPTIVYAGRMIPEKRVPLLVEAIALARKDMPDLHATLFGRGPELERVRADVAARGLETAIRVPGFVSGDEINAAIASALCVVQPSAREGYGLIVAEASALGAPVVVIAGDDNAAAELVEPGRNGFVAAEATPAALADAILRCARAGETLRASTRRWYGENARRLSLAQSLEIVTTAYSRSDR